MDSQNSAAHTPARSPAGRMPRARRGGDEFRCRPAPPDQPGRNRAARAAGPGSRRPAAPVPPARHAGRKAPSSSRRSAEPGAPAPTPLPRAVRIGRRWRQGTAGMIRPLPSVVASSHAMIHTPAAGSVADGSATEPGVSLDWAGSQGRRQPGRSTQPARLRARSADRAERSSGQSDAGNAAPGFPGGDHPRLPGHRPTTGNSSLSSCDPRANCSKT